VNRRCHLHRRYYDSRKEDFYDDDGSCSIICGVYAMAHRPATLHISSVADRRASWCGGNLPVRKNCVMVSVACQSASRRPQASKRGESRAYYPETRPAMETSEVQRRCDIFLLGV
jgi:hypothetical protein